LVIVGNRPALVIHASTERLLVVAAEDAHTGEIRADGSSAAMTRCAFGMAW
jgi:hypothetical protein